MCLARPSWPSCPKRQSGHLFLLKIISSRFLVLLVMQTALFAAMFMFLPNRRNKFLPSLPGALLASLGWQLFSGFFSLYVEHFSNFSTIYGSLSAVAHCHVVAVYVYGHCILRRRAEQIPHRHWLSAPLWRAEKNSRGF